MKKKLMFLALFSAFLFTACGKEPENSPVFYSDLKFSDIYGQEYDDVFKSNKLTIVNMFATWCVPCLQEIPELERLNDELKEQDIAVIGIVADARMDGQVQDDVVEMAKEIAEAAEISYPFLVLDESGFKGYIDSMSVVPETLFIDSDGYIVDSVIGSNDFDDWMAITERVVDQLEE